MNYVRKRYKMLVQVYFSHKITFQLISVSVGCRLKSHQRPSSVTSSPFIIIHITVRRSAWLVNQLRENE